MTKIEFILSLNEKLSALPQDEVRERLNFYSEMIEDRMEEGLSEEESVLAVGSVDEIAAQIASEIPCDKNEKEKARPKRRFKAWEIVLLVLGSPIWLSLLVAAFAVILSLYAVLWSVIISLWSVFASFTVCAPSGIVAGVGFVIAGKTLSGIAVISSGIVCAGLSILSFYGCKALTRANLLLTKNIALYIKKCFTRREEA